MLCCQTISCLVITSVSFRLTWGRRLTISIISVHRKGWFPSMVRAQSSYHLFHGHGNRNVHIAVTKWCIVGYLSNALWDLWNGSTRYWQCDKVICVIPICDRFVILLTASGLHGQRCEWCETRREHLEAGSVRHYGGIAPDSRTTGDSGGKEDLLTHCFPGWSDSDPQVIICWFFLWNENIQFLPKATFGLHYCHWLCLSVCVCVSMCVSCVSITSLSPW